MTITFSLSIASLIFSNIPYSLPIMSFTVTKQARVMVRPAQSTPSENLELSSIDRFPGLNAKVRTFHVFEHGQEPCKVIREALAKALVYYYPFAGRLFNSADDGELQVACTGDGVWFIDASANCSLREIGCPEMPLHEDLLPDPAPGEDPAKVIMLLQVTEFDCGGFVIGLENNHCIADGLGTAQFLNTLAEFARGLPSPSLTPIWCPSAIPSPLIKPMLAPQDLPPPSIFHLQNVTIDLPLELITSFKSHFFSITHQPCSTFEALAATLWQSRTRAILRNANFMEVRLVFMANARPLVHPALPQGFCSNCFFPVNILADGEWLASTTVVEIVKLIKKAKSRLPEEFSRWVAGEGEDPYLPVLGYATLFLSEWSKLGFEKVDYGWGPPKQVVPLMYSDIIPVCIVGLPPTSLNGVRLSTQCVEVEHVKEFEECMTRAWESRGWKEEIKIGVLQHGKCGFPLQGV